MVILPGATFVLIMEFNFFFVSPTETIRAALAATQCGLFCLYNVVKVYMK